ncbi:MAG: CapA family protein [Cytophagales bacterium]|nr:CapA family protein [Cytophagales bacterium]
MRKSIYFLFILIAGKLLAQEDTLQTIRLTAVGDMMMGTNYPNATYLPSGNGSYLWKEVQERLKNSDITFGNLEGVLLTEGGTPKKCNNPSACYVFRTPEKYAFNFKEAGFDLLSLANNHANDFGRTGRLNTQRVLDSLNISFAGSTEKPYVITKIKGLKVGMAAFAPNSGTRSLHNLEEIKSTMKLLNEQCDIVIASMHGGAEGVKNRHVTKQREYYYGENRGNVYELAHMMIDNGADVVIGHGPHVVRAMEVYKNRLIAYSLGNFLTYKKFSMKGATGESPILELEITEEGEFISGQIYSYRQSYDHLGPKPDDQNGASRSIKKLSEEDFPKSSIFIDDSGRITYLENVK